MKRVDFVKSDMIKKGTKEFTEGRLTWRTKS